MTWPRGPSPSRGRRHSVPGGRSSSSTARWGRTGRSVMPPALLWNSRAMVPSSTATTGVLRGARMSIASCSGRPPRGRRTERDQLLRVDAFDRHPRSRSLELRRGSTAVGPITAAFGTGGRRRRRRRSLPRARRQRVEDGVGVVHRRPASARSLAAASRADGARLAARDPITLPNCQTTAPRRTRRRRSRSRRRRRTIRSVRCRSPRLARVSLIRVNTTRVPGLTSAASFSASQFVSRTQPCDAVLPTVAGSGVPCRP